METANLPVFLKFVKAKKNQKFVLSLQKIISGHETGESKSKTGGCSPLPGPGLKLLLVCCRRATCIQYVVQQIITDGVWAQTCQTVTAWMMCIIGDRIIYRTLPVYSDLTYQLTSSNVHRPNPRVVSNTVLRGPSGLPSYRNRTALFAFFGILSDSYIPVLTKQGNSQFYNAKKYLCAIMLPF